MDRAEPPNDDIRAVDDFLAAAMCGTPLPDPKRTDLLLERALYHGASALLAANPEAMRVLPAEIRSAISQQALGETMWDLRHRQILTALLEAIAGAGIKAVILKGTALAYGCYPAPSLRPRGDTDVLVQVDTMTSIRGVMAGQGFTRIPDINADAPDSLVRQESWSRGMPDGGEHSIDLHKEVMNIWNLAHAFDSDSVFRASQPIPTLSPFARMMGFPHAIYHSCLHRAVHIKNPYYVGEKSYFGGDRLIWLYDIHLMIPRLTAEDQEQLIGFCRRDGTADLCLDALVDAQERLGTSVPEFLMARLAAAATRDGPRRYLEHDPEWRRMLADLAAIPRIRDRLRFLRALIFPPPSFMRAKYPDMPNTPVLLLHLRRLGGALWRRSRNRSS